VMTIFYMVNHRDEDMKMYSWEVVSCTVSIFLANLFFHALQSLVTLAAESLGEHEHSGPAHSTLQFGLFLICIGLLHVTIVWYSKHGFKNYNAWQLEQTKNPSQQSKQKGHFFLKEDEQGLICWATLVAHVCGFAAMHSGAILQMWMLNNVGGHPEHEDINSPEGVGVPMAAVLTILPVLAWVLMMFGLFWLSDVIRTKRYKGDCAQSEKFYEVYDEHAEETENDVAALAVSFIIVQHIRCMVTGRLPGPEGEESEDMDTYTPAWILSGFVILFVALRIGMIKLSCFKAEKHESDSDMDCRKYGKRWAIIIQMIMSMIFAWCILATGTAAVSTFLQIHQLADKGYKPNGAAVLAVLAMIVSIVAFIVITILDKISDKLSDLQVDDPSNDDPNKESDSERAIRGIIKALGILVGFSWEQAFAGGVEAIVETEPIESPWFPVILQFGLAITIGFGVVPAWRDYILRNLLNFQIVHAEMKQQQKMARQSCASERAPLKSKP